MSQRPLSPAVLPARVPERVTDHVVDLASRAAGRLAQRPSNTSRAYASDWSAWAAWCSTWGGDPCAPVPGTLATYVEHLAEKGLAPSTVDRALTGIRAGLIASGLGKGAASDVLELARERARLYRADAARAGFRERRAKAITVDDLRAMIGALDLDTLSGLRDRALLLLGFCAALRRSEAAALNWADLETVDEGLLAHVWRPKTARLDAVPIARGVTADTCAVLALAAWHDAAMVAGAVPGGPTFIRIDQRGRLGRCPSNKGDPDGRMTGQAIGSIVKRAAKRAGLHRADAYSGHSLRRGFATESRRAGADPLRIARVGGWADGSTQLWRYVEDVDRWVNHPLGGTGL